MGVNLVVLNIDSDGTCAETLRSIRPDIFAKGAEYTLDNIPESELAVCREIGCKVVTGVGERLNCSSKYYRSNV